MDDQGSFGRWVKCRRKTLGLTQKELAQQINCSLSVIQKIEIDERRPSREIAELLAHHLELGAEERDAFIHLARAHPRELQPIPSIPHTPESRFDNLPIPLTALVGREWEVETLRASLLRSDIRLLTISGPPGIGKTRLALHTARTLLDDFAHGACFVALAPLVEGSYVISAIARALGVGELERQPLVERLKSYLRGKHLLLVLDNFEHILGAAPVVVELLESAPQIKMLVTSRTLLQLYGEHEFVAPPLALPDLKHLPSPRDLIRFAAIELFVQRARAAKLDFVLSEQNARSVAELCVHLDGLPLAIELAAARSKQLSPDALLARLTSSQGEGVAHLNVLAAKVRNLPPRQQTLYAAVDWSYNLLTQVEQRVFRALGVFAGGCNLPALAAVNGVPSATPGSWLLDVANSLVDKSLVVAQGEDDEQRFALLEMIREYALQQLVDNGDIESVRQAHAEHFLALGEAIDGRDKVGQEQAVMTIFPREHNNLRAALSWGLQHDPTKCLFLVAYLADFGNELELHYETKDWLERVLARAEPEVSRRYAHATRRMATVLWSQGDLSAAETWIRTSVVRWRRLDDDYELGIALVFQSLILLHSDEYEAARLPAQEAVTLLHIEPRTGWLPIALRTLSDIDCVLGDYVAASALTQESLALFHQQSNTWGVGVSQIAIANMAYAQGDFDKAHAQYEEALRSLPGPNRNWLAARALWSLGKVHWHQEEPERAVACWQESIITGRPIGAKEWVAGSLLLLGLASQADGDADEACNFCSESLALYRQMEHDAGIAYALTGLAGVLGLHATSENVSRESAQPESALLVSATQALAVAARLLANRRKLQDDLERHHYERIVASVRSRLVSHAFATAWATGQTMPLEHVVASALTHIRGYSPLTNGASF